MKRISVAFACCVLVLAAEAQQKPNILVLWGDDIGVWNVSKYSHGQMGYKTPNIDRIGNEGVMFTDYYGQQSCTAGRAAFLTGQNPFRTGLTKVGLPGAEIGLQKEDPTIAEILKPLGYATGQFGKNHLGDKDEFLPSNHGFDEFYGNLYHLNAEEEPEEEDYPGDYVFADGETFEDKFLPRGVIHSYADGRVEDTGPLNRKRMETVDDETAEEAMRFIRDAVAAGTPFFVWWNGTRMHFKTHIKEEVSGLSGQGFYNDGMVEHDMHVGQFLDLLDELGITDNTIVMYSTDNGVHYNTWPDAGITPFRGEKNTNWEGAFRVPCVARWPGKWQEGAVLNGIAAHQDWFTTLIAAAGIPDIADRIKSGHKAGDMTYKKYIDGLDLNPYLAGEVTESPRNKFFYTGDGGEVMAVRVGDWKMVFMEQRASYFDIWREPFVTLRAPKIFNLRRDPFERADIGSNNYNEFWEAHAPYIYLGLATVREALASVIEYPPTQKPDSWNLDKIVDQIETNLGN